MRMHYLAALCAAGLAANSALRAQITTQVTLNFSATISAVSEGSNVIGQIAGAGSVAPFGDATLVGSAIFGPSENVNGDSILIEPYTFTFSDGSTFQISQLIFLGMFAGVQEHAIGTVLGGTGIFANATGSVTIASALVECEADGGPPTVRGPPYCPEGVQFTASGSITTPGIVSASPSALPFSFIQGSSTAASLPITLTNGTSQPISFTTATSGESWLSVSPSNPRASAFSSGTVSVTANPAGLSAATYTASVTLSASGQQFTVPVTLTVSSAQLAIAISQSALRFQTAAGGGVPPSQSITVLNQGTGPLNWSAKASALSGKWLSVAPTSGTAGQAAIVSIDPTGLTPGDYYGLVKFTATGAADSPQAAVVVLNVLPSTSTVETVEPTGLIFIGQQGGANPATETVTLSNPSAQSITVTASTLAQQNGVFSVAPSGSTSVASGQSAAFTISANTTGLTAGVYPAIIQFLFGDGAVQQVALVLIVTPSGSAARPGLRAMAAASCTPTKLIPASTGLEQSFTEVAAWPVPLIVEVDDDCGNPMGPGSVIASFSNGDPPQSLVALGSGSWSGTWNPSYTGQTASVTITIQAESTQPALSGTAQISGMLNPNQSAPTIARGGIVSAASLAANAPLAPGSFTSIFGVNFASSPNPAAALPLATALGGTQVLIGDEFMPLLFSGSGQANGIIPYDIAPNTTQQLIVQQGLAYSLPQPVTIARAQPAVFTQNQSGSGIGVIEVVKPDGTQFEAGPSSPATAGDALVIYCTGLGAVSPAIAAGASAPNSPLTKTSDPATVTMGAKPAQVLFAGLAPGFAEVYQVNAVIPSGIASGPSVPIVITVSGLSSPPVTVPIH